MKLEATRETTTASSSSSSSPLLLLLTTTQTIALEKSVAASTTTTTTGCKEEEEIFHEELPAFSNYHHHHPSTTTTTTTLSSSSSSSLQRIHWLTVHTTTTTTATTTTATVAGPPPPPPRITVAALCQGGIRADGCHSTLDGERGLVITYIHLAARCRRTQISRFLEKAFGTAAAATATTTTTTTTTAGPVTRVIEAVCDKSLIETPEFQLLARHFVEHDNGLVCDGGGMGLLSRFNRCWKELNNNNNNFSSLSSAKKQPALLLELENAELRQRIASLERDRLGMEDRLHAAYSEKLRAENGMGSMRQALFKANHSLCGYESELKRLRIENSEFRRLGVREKEARRLNRELLTLQGNLEDKTKDCRMLEMMLCIAREDNDKLERMAAMAPRPRPRQHDNNNNLKRCYDDD